MDIGHIAVAIAGREGGLTDMVEEKYERGDDRALSKSPGRYKKREDTDNGR